MNALKDLVCPELKLLANLSRPSLNREQQGLARQLIPTIDFHEFRSLVDQHRVWPCVYCNIRDHFSSSVPPELLSHLERKYDQNIELSQLQFKAYGQILYQFNQAKIPVRTLKGIPLARKLYGDQVKRHSKDIDLLIPPEYFELAHSKLLEIGFKESFQDFSPFQNEDFFKKHKDVSYNNDEGVQLELHIRLSTHNSILSATLTKQLFSNSDTSDTNEFIYLSWHGAHSLFHRIKWILDIALHYEQHFALPDSLDRLLAEAEEKDETRSVVLSLMLAKVFYDTELPAKIENLYSTDWFLPRLAEIAICNMQKTNNQSKLKQIFEIFICELILPRHLSTKLKILTYLAIPNANDFKMFKFVPKNLNWAYYFLRPLRLFYLYGLGRHKNQ